MRLLLDTHAIIWHMERNPLLSTVARQAIQNGDNDIFLSAVSIWEMSIKVSLGKLNLPKPVSVIIEELESVGVGIVAMTREHALFVGTLPLHHRDPFDRMLISQAKFGGMSLVTHDGMFNLYDVSVVW